MPGTVLLKRQNTKGVELQRTVRMDTWPQVVYEWYPGVSERTNSAQPAGMAVQLSIKFKASRWDYNGNFYQVKSDEELTWYAEDDSSVSMSTHPLSPSQFLDANEQQIIESRGQKFWECRFRKYVSYSEWNSSKMENYVSGTSNTLGPVTHVRRALHGSWSTCGAIGNLILSRK